MCPNSNVSGSVMSLWKPILCSNSAHNTKSWQEWWFAVYPKMHFCFNFYYLPKPALYSGQNTLSDLDKWFALPCTRSLQCHPPMMSSSPPLCCFKPWYCSEHCQQSQLWAHSSKRPVWWILHWTPHVIADPITLLLQWSIEMASLNRPEFMPLLGCLSKVSPQ